VRLRYKISIEDQCVNLPNCYSDEYYIKKKKKKKNSLEIHGSFIFGRSKKNQAEGDLQTPQENGLENV